MAPSTDAKSDPGPQDIEQQTAVEKGRLFFARECRFLLGVAGLDQLPDTSVNEVAFAGRSNVGKSSLLNALTGRNDLARTSNTPGRTQQLNYFEITHPDIGALRLVDLPGYGYARVSKSQVGAWTRLLKSYLKGRPNLRRAMVLIDARHGIKASDREIMTMLDDAAVSYQAVLTKADKVKPTALADMIETVTAELRRHVAAHPEVTATSAVKGRGIADLRASLAMLAS